MGNRLKRIACALVALLILATGWTFAETGPVAPERDIVVLFTSDVHCGVDQGFGYAGLKAIRDELERDGNGVLLVDDQLSFVVAKCTAELTINDPTAVDEAGKPVRIIRRAETNLGDLIADAFRARSGAEVGVACAGSIRKGLPKGEVTMNDVLSTYPFGNRVYKAEVTGQQILNALEWGARMVPEESGGFLHVSGMTYEIHTDIPSGCKKDGNGLFAGVEGEYRVKNVMIGGEPLESDRVYTLATQDFTLLNHGDGQTAFDGARTIWQADVPDYGVVAEYLQANLNGVVGEAYANPYGQGRIVAVG